MNTSENRLNQPEKQKAKSKKQKAKSKKLTFLDLSCLLSQLELVRKCWKEQNHKHDFLKLNITAFLDQQKMSAKAYKSVLN